MYDGRDKTFFFFAYERYSLLASKPYQSRRMESTPTAGHADGRFQPGLVSSAGVLQQLYDPGDHDEQPGLRRGLATSPAGRQPRRSTAGPGLGSVKLSMGTQIAFRLNEETTLWQRP